MADARPLVAVLGVDGVEAHRQAERLLLVSARADELDGVVAGQLRLVAQ